MPDATPLSRALDAATGYCELKMWLDAWDELEALPAEDRARPDVFRIRLGIFTGLEKWESAAVLARSMVANGCREPAAYMLGSYAMRRCETVAAAKTFLLAGQSLLAGNATFNYTLACFECQLGDMPAAKARLEVAFGLDPSLRLMALNDADLYPIW